jgi:pentatricopeptide repeat protein
VTFNSLITALAQGAQWEKAQEVFEQMRASGCRPDVVTYTALISALEKGGQWRLALEVSHSRIMLVPPSPALAGCSRRRASCPWLPHPCIVGCWWLGQLEEL